MTARKKAEWRHSVTVDRHSERPVLGAYKTQKILYGRRVQGLPTSISADTIGDHVRWLHGMGFGDPAIGAAAGVSHAAVYRIRLARRQLTQHAIAGRLRMVGHVPVPAQSGLIVPAHGTRRRLQALLTIGWTQAALGDLLDVSDAQVHQWAHPRLGNLYETWHAVADVYDQLSGTPGPSSITRDRAAKRGWLPPLAWEGIDIDDPWREPVETEDDADPAVDEVLLHRILRGEHEGEIPKPERTAVLNHAIEHNWNKTRVAQVLGVKLATADQALVRMRRELRQQTAA
jgi:hypothetical protein